MRILGKNGTKKHLGIILIFTLLVLLAFFYSSQSLSRTRTRSRIQLKPTVSVSSEKTEEGLRNNRSLRVVILEEHQTALTYWMKAADERVIPRFNNILGAAAAGLVSRFVWIFPSWDPKILKNGRRYTRKEVQVGHLRNVAQDSLTNYICACLIDEAGTKACEVDDPDVVGDAKALEDLYSDLPGTCSIEHTYLSEYVHEGLALKLLNDATWILPETSVILDIGEDYFGCQLVRKNLVKAGIRWKDIDHLDFLFGQMLCPPTLLEEELSDSLTKELLALFYKTCTWSDPSTCSTSTAELTARTRRSFLKLKTNHLNLFCLSEESRSFNTWKKLLRHLKSFTIPQLQAIIDTSFCLKTLYRYPSNLEDPGNFMVCHGHNTPMKNIVYLHMPNRKEIKRRADLLEAMFQSKGLLQTKLVTLARSMRDGYTPREYAKEIETYIIQGLQHSRTLNITYDEQLLCGSLGLSSRREFVLA